MRIAALAALCCLFAASARAGAGYERLIYSALPKDFPGSAGRIAQNLAKLKDADGEYARSVLAPIKERLAMSEESFASLLQTGDGRALAESLLADALEAEAASVEARADRAVRERGVEAESLLRFSSFFLSGPEKVRRLEAAASMPRPRGFSQMVPHAVGEAQAFSLGDESLPDAEKEPEWIAAGSRAAALDPRVKDGLERAQAMMGALGAGMPDKSDRKFWERQSSRLERMFLESGASTHELGAMVSDINRWIPLVVPETEEEGETQPVDPRHPLEPAYRAAVRELVEVLKRARENLSQPEALLENADEPGRSLGRAISLMRAIHSGLVDSRLLRRKQPVIPGTSIHRWSVVIAQAERLIAAPGAQGLADLSAEVLPLLTSLKSSGGNWKDEGGFRSENFKALEEVMGALSLYSRGFSYSLAGEDLPSHSPKERLARVSALMERVISDIETYQSTLVAGYDDAKPHSLFKWQHALHLARVAGDEKSPDVAALKSYVGSFRKRYLARVLKNPFAAPKVKEAHVSAVRDIWAVLSAKQKDVPAAPPAPAAPVDYHGWTALSMRILYLNPNVNGANDLAFARDHMGGVEAYLAEWDLAARLIDMGEQGKLGEEEKARLLALVKGLLATYRQSPDHHFHAPLAADFLSDLSALTGGAPTLELESQRQARLTLRRVIGELAGVEDWLARQRRPELMAERGGDIGEWREAQGRARGVYSAPRPISRAGVIGLIEYVRPLAESFEAALTAARIPRLEGAEAPGRALQLLQELEERLAKDD